MKETNSFVRYKGDGLHTMYRSRMLVAQKYVVLILDINGDGWLKNDVAKNQLDTVWDDRNLQQYEQIHIPFPLPAGVSVSSTAGGGEFSLVNDWIRVRAEGVYELWQDSHPSNVTQHRIKRSVVTNGELYVDFKDATCANVAAVDTFWNGRAGHTYKNLLEL